MAPPRFIKAYRFALYVGGADHAYEIKGLATVGATPPGPRNVAPVPTCAMRWEGDDLVIFSGMAEWRAPLYQRLRDANTVEVELFDATGDVARRWRAQYVAVRNRGFMCTDAAEDAVALEQVVLKDCQLLAAP